MKLHKTIISIILSISFLAGTLNVPAQESDDQLLAVRRAFYEATGHQWDDASPDTQEKFLKIFARREKARIKFEVTRKRNRDRKERAKVREKKNDQRQLDNLEKAYLRKKRNEERQLIREKRERERKIREMKRKMAQQRKKNH